ncbi:hypothetical protein JXI42_01125 [bacterium]|nr:hypothetical protein [bacterium]
MKNFLVTLILAGFLAGVVFAAEITWTGGGGDTDWNNSWNWSSWSVPGPNDDVRIPAGGLVTLPSQVSVRNLINEGQISTFGAPAMIVVSEDIYNFGYITIGGVFTVFCGYSFNNFSIVGADGIYIKAVDVGNSEDASILCHDSCGYSLIIEAKRDLANDGLIIGGSKSSGDISSESVYLKSDRIHNDGEIRGGDGIDSVDGGNVFCRCRIMDNDSIIAGGNPGGYRTKPGKVKILAKVFTGKKPIFSNIRSERKTDDFNNITIAADTILFQSEKVYMVADSIVFKGKTIIFDGLPGGSIYGVSGLYFYTPAGGIIDFENNHVAPTFSTPGENIIFCDSVIEPIEGLDYIMSYAPVINPAATGMADGDVMVLDEVSYTEETDTLVLSLFNLSMSPKVLNYSVTSSRGWLSPTTNVTPTLDPFEIESVIILFTIPDGTPFGLRDTITTVLTIAPDFTDTFYTYLTSLGERVEYDTIIYELSAGWNMLSFPFYDTINVLGSFPFALGSAWEYNSVTASYDEIESAPAGVGFWLLCPNDTTIFVEGEKADTIDYAFEPGWHMISGPADTIPVEALTDLEAVWDDIFGYDPILRRYVIVDFLLPGFSYWVFIEDTVEFSLL